jgi:MFS family permease
MSTGQQRLTVFSWIIVFIALFLLSASSMARNVWAVSIPLAIPRLDLSNAAAGSLMSAYFIGYLIANFFIGSLVDRYGCRKTLTISALFCGLFTILIPLGGSYKIIFLLRFLAGFSNGSFFAGCVNYILGWVPPKFTGIGIGVAFTGSQFGIAFSNLFFAGLVSAGAWAQPFIYTAIVCWVVGALVVVLGKEQGAALPKKQENASLISSFRGVFEFFKNRSYVAGCLAKLIDLGAWQGVATWMVVYLSQSRGFSVSEAGSIFGSVSLICVAGYVLTGILGDVTGRRKMVAVMGSILNFIFLLLALYSNSTAMLWVTLGLFMLINQFAGIQYNTMQALTCAGPNSGAAMAWYNAINWLGAVIYPPLLGWVLDATGSQFMIFVPLLITFVLEALICGLFMSDKVVNNVPKVKSAEAGA